jgi:hypothetical protein
MGFERFKYKLNTREMKVLEESHVKAEWKDQSQFHDDGIVCQNI